MRITATLMKMPALAGLVALLSSGSARAGGPSGAGRSGQGRPRRGNRLDRGGDDSMGRSPPRGQAGLACLLAEPRRFRLADDDRLEAAARVFGGAHPLAGARAFCAKRHRQLRLCRNRRSPGSDRRPERAGGGTNRRARRRSILARLRRYLHPGKCQIRLEPAGRGATRRPRSCRRATVRGGPPASAGTGAVRDPLRVRSR